MTFLQKLGKVLGTVVNIAGIAAGVGPVLQSFLGSAAPKVASTIGTVTNDLSAIGGIVVQAEAMIQASGSGIQKLAAATPLVANIIQTSELISGKKIANETLFIQGSQKITSGMADILNSLHADSVSVNPGAAVTVIPATETSTAQIAPIA